MKILLSGASGFLGSAFRKLAENDDIIPLSNRISLPGAIPLPLEEMKRFPAVLGSSDAETLIHLAAIREPDLCETEPERAAILNRDAVLRLAESLPEEKRFVFISTDYVFSGKDPIYTESDLPDPVNVYGRMKAEAEAGLAERPNTTIVRIPVLVGADPDPAKPGFISLMIEALKSGKAQQIDNVLVRHPTWIEDVARGVFWLAHEQKDGIWQISSKQGGTRYELTQRVAEVLGLDASHLEPSSDIVARKAERPLNSALSAAKFLEAGGPRPHELEEILEHLELS